MSNTDSIKTTIAEFTVDHYELKGLIGLGSGTTLEAWVHALGKDLKNNPKKYQNCKFISSSVKTENLARQLGLNLLTLSQIQELTTNIDFYIDGLDQVDSTGKMIKGKGGALTREKILCQYSSVKIFLCDSSKLTKSLNSYLPIEIIPLAYPFIKKKLQKELQINSVLRLAPSFQIFVTDNGNWTLDISLPKNSESWRDLANQISSWAGVVETGFFEPNPFDLVIGYPDQKIEIQKF